MIKNRQNNLKELLKILADGAWHSGRDLGVVLGMTRAAIWKLVGQLKNWCVDIEAKTQQGYRIPSGLELLNIETIKNFLPQRYWFIMNHIIVFDVIDSTHDYLLQDLRANDYHYQLCLAEYQTKGRGRFGRPWLSFFGRNVYLSLLCSFTTDLTKLSGLSLLVAIAVTRVLNKFGIREGLGLKWPNDVLWQGKKLSGILIDLYGESHHSCDAVISIGVNLHGTFQPELAIVSVAEIMGSIVPRNQFIACLLEVLYDLLGQFKQYGFTSFVAEWNHYDVAFNKPVRLLFGEKIIEGIYRGIDAEYGTLLLENAQGAIEHYSAGEVSLRF